ncbi:MAG: TetR/AcrR family transcriptional regulator, partial [Alphaproteobacteria bacterium]|nr:TetR/AcrR family transcriptional regulator [Alphaproteobacteria bacterium]
MTSDRAGSATPSAPDEQQPGTKGARTKALIKRTIIDLVGEHGPLEVTLQDICKAANVTVGAFYFHFRNKDAALEETATEAARIYYEALVPQLDDRPLRERLENLMQAFLDNYIE